MSDVPAVEADKAPAVELSNRPFNLEGAIAALRKVAADRAGPARDVYQPRVARFTSPKKLRKLAPAAAALLTRDLYSHQVQAIQAGIDGKDVIIATSTASGKSLCYQTLAAHHLSNANGTVLYLAPINALLMDQMDAFERFLTGHQEVAQRYENDIEAYARPMEIGGMNFHLARYDGTVPGKKHKYDPIDLRGDVRKCRPRLLLTNPEMLTRAILNRASREKGADVEVDKSSDDWAYFFRGLRLVVIDELHAYRGIFGAHLANILRRVRRMVHVCGGKADALRFIACTATIRDPARTAKAILGVDDVTVIDESANASPRYRRVLVPVNSEGEKLESFATRLLPAVAFEGGARTIAFRDNIPAIMGLRKALTTRLGPDKVDTYCASNRVDEKMDKLYQLRAGETRCLIATSALELGIDIGELNASMLLGYPGAIAKTWQMLGRAGRSGDGLLVYVAGSNYLDQYWFEHIDELVGDKAEPEDVIVDPDNEYVVEEHLRGAALDHVIDPKRDKRFFGKNFQIAFDRLKETDEGIRLEEEVWILRSEGEQRAREISLRSLGQYKVPVFVDSRGDKPLLEEESNRAPKRLFPGAIFSWEDNYYVCRDLCIPQDRAARIKEKVFAIVSKIENPKYLTEARSSEETSIITKMAGAGTAEPEAGWGQVKVRARVDGFYKRFDAIAEIEGHAGTADKTIYCPFSEDSGPPHHEYITQGAWFALGPGITGAVPVALLGPALRTVAEAMVRAAPLLRFASPGDLTADVCLPDEAVTPSLDEGTNRKCKSNSIEPRSVIHINETVLGGAGLAKQMFERRREIIKQAVKLLRDCAHCGRRRAKTNGCPRCVSLPDGKQHRRAALLVFEAWEVALASGASRKKAPLLPTTAEVLKTLGFDEPEPIGHGGMGTVWRAVRDNEQVAVKLLKAGGGAETRLWHGEALEKEAERLSRLDHPHILRVRAVHRFKGGLAIELDWADGGTLADFVERKHSQSELIQVWRKIVEAVAYLHGQKVVHRDLKDSNVLFHADEPLVADFGIARDLKVEKATTRVLGTADWAAPEQLSAASGKATVAPTMDVWGLGKLLEFVFTGGLGAIKDDQMSAFPETIPKQLHAVFPRCLASDPKARFKDAGELLASLPKPARPKGGAG